MSAPIQRSGCAIEDCEKQAVPGRKGWCEKHYIRWHRHGDPLADKRPAARERGACAHEGCAGRDETAGYCRAHYEKERRYGHGVTERSSKASIQERFSRQFVPSGPGECWEWTGARNDYGYGTIGDERGRPKRAHRVSYELHIGPISDGLVVMHSCDNPPCVNPAHLSLGTIADNNWDRARKGRTRGPWSVNR